MSACDLEVATVESMAVPPVTGELAEFVARSRWDDLPSEVRADAAGAVLNLLGAMLGGASDGSIRLMLDALKQFSDSGTTTVVGRCERIDAASAALINAATANVLDFDDTHSPTLIHPGAPVLGALLALAETGRTEGKAFLHAFVLGAEVACRVGLAMHPRHYERGWHITATCGVIGAAAACAKLLGLDALRTRHAIGIAASHSSGLIENLSSMAKSIGVGEAARNGLTSALLAQAGVDAAPAALEGRFGLLRVACDESRPADALDGLGHRWEALSKCAKPYPCCALIFPALDACMQLRKEQGFVPDEVESIHVTGSPLMLVRAGIVSPSSEREARLSIPHSVAVALVRGTARVEDYLEAALADATVRSLAHRVTTSSDDSFGSESAMVDVKMRDGRSFNARIAQGRGTPARPMTMGEICDKVGELARLTLDAAATERFIRAWSALERCDDVGSLMPLLVPQSA